MKRWIAGALILSLLVATSGMAADDAAAPQKPGQAGPLALQITGGVLAGLGALIFLAASGSDEMGSDVAATEGLIGIGVGTLLFTTGTVWRHNRASAAGRPATSLELNLLGPAPGLFARATF